MKHKCNLPAEGHVVDHSPVNDVRMGWIDAARGIGIILVVYGHALRGLYPRLAEQPDWVRVQDSAIYAFHMPLFFILAGYWLWPSISQGRATFFRKKVVAVLYPYFLWSLLAGALEILAHNYVNTPIKMDDLVRIPIVPIEQFWFLYALFFGQLFIAGIYPHRFLLPLVIALAGYVFVVGGFGIATISEIAMAVLYLAIGVLVARWLERLAKREAFFLLGVFIIAFAIIATTLGLALTDWPTSILRALVGSTGVFALAIVLSRLRVSTFELLGRSSMAIYVMHTIASAATRTILIYSDLRLPVATMLALITAAGLIVPMFVWWIVGLAGHSKLFGLPPTSSKRSTKASVLRRTG